MLKMVRLHFRRLVTISTALLAAYIVLTYFSRSYKDVRSNVMDEETIRRLIDAEAEAQREAEKAIENWQAAHLLVKREEDVVVPNPAKPHIHNMQDMMKQVFRAYNLPDDMLAMDPPKYLQNFKNPCWYERDTDPPAKSYNHTLDGVRVKLRCLPYFHLIGVDKSGTTDLWARLAHHPQFVRPKAVMGKETHWWSWRRFGFDIWVRNALIRHFDWYLEHWDSSADKILRETVTINNTVYHPVITGEGSPTVFWDFTGWDMMPQNKGKKPEEAFITPHCIHHLTPNAKLILMLRNPVERMYSEYLFLDRFKAVHNLSAQLFHEGVSQSIDMYEKCVQVHSSRACLYNKTLHMKMPVRVLVGLYSEWLEQWLEVFPITQILILRNEDYAKDMATTLNAVIDFLGLSKLSEEEMKKITQMDRSFTRSEKEKKVGDMLPETRSLLEDFYWEYSMKLSKILGDVRFMWQDQQY
ncbi:hypothetical protein BaRGS_00002089 [Batillaria attramentaria]|uniref:Sulfotransferase domain-containing protein n=1 Tax=Batillaria attramentaria TaxID=370345 RepID=A0ABD0M3X6_9CAEN